jgi:hypothetical protein
MMAYYINIEFWDKIPSQFLSYMYLLTWNGLGSVQG